MKTKGLSIQEAIQSGFVYYRESQTAFFDKTDSILTLGKDDLLATDWQIKAPEVTITREKLTEVWESYGSATYASLRESIALYLFTFVKN